MSEVDAESANSPTEETLQSLGITLPSDLPLRLDTMFPRLEGWGVKGELKRKAKLIQAVAPRLRAILKDGEEVLFISRGTQSSFAEAYFMGALWANYVNQTVFVLTSLRLVLMHCTSKGVPKEPNWMLFYSEIAEFKGSWTGMVNLRLQDGKKYRYSGFPKTDRKAMPQIFEDALQRYRELGFSPEVSQSREDLCGTCFQVVPKADRSCDGCGATFWSPGQLAVRSLVFPSWGDFLMGHTLLGVVEVFGWGSTLLIAFFIGTAGGGGGGWEAWAVAIGVIAFSHTVDAILTWNLAKKGLHTRTRGDTDLAAAT